MLTDGDRILANLPPTFAPLPRPTALATIADGFGGELVGAENSLAAMMFAHWVDTADTDGHELMDLPAIAALYGLAPRDDETIEGFRAHLKQHVLTFIDGTMTVRGALRVVAEALGLTIADALDTWWDRDKAHPLVVVKAVGDDAAALLFGVASALARGMPARAAGFAGTVDLSQPIDLHGRTQLRLAVDGSVPATFDLPAVADRAAIIAAVNAIAGVVAEPSGTGLLIRTRSAGAASNLELLDVAGDAVPAILGLAPHEYAGSAAAGAQISGIVDLAPTLDLSTRRYLRFTIDGVNSVEVDCAGANPGATTPAEVVAAIGAEAGAGVAGLGGPRLVLTSPTLGLAGTIAVRVPTTGDATAILLGDVATYARGSDATPARVSGVVDLSAGIDLSQRANLLLAIDAIAPVLIDCVGAVPQQTLAWEIAAAINTAVGLPVADQNGTNVTLTSRAVGPTGRIRFLTAPTADALDLIFGFASRSARGADATYARLTGSVDLHQGVDLRAVNRLRIAVDDGTPTTIALPAAGAVMPADIVATLDGAGLGSAASTDGAHLILTSASPGEQGSVALVPIEHEHRPDFVTRAFPTGEASSTVLGVLAAQAQGTDGARAMLAGGVDLHDGLDLRQTRYLRVAIDGGVARDVDCAGRSQRPRAVLLSDLVAAIDQGLGSGIASIATGRLVLASPSVGARSTVAPLANAGDASALIFGAGPLAATGGAARAVVFTGLRDLSKGVDLSAADHIRLAIDGAAPVEIVCAGGTPAQTSPAEIVGSINAALGATYASTDGSFVRLASPTAGHAGLIAFLAPTQRDATRLVFGINPGRVYHGDDATAATLTGAFAATLDLFAAPYLTLAAVNAGTPVRVDCRGSDPAHTTPAEIASAIATALPAGLSATVDADRVVLATTSVATTAQLAVLPSDDADASEALLGAAVAVPSSGPTPATLVGTIDLRTPVDLSQRSVLRLGIDGGRPVDIDVAGAAPDATYGTEIAAAVNAELAGVAALDGNGHLVLTSPTSGADSAIAVLPLRALEVIEYPPAPASRSTSVGSGAAITLANDGAEPSAVTFTLSNPSGFCGGDLISLVTGWRIHIEAGLGGTESLTISAAADGGLEARRVDATGHASALPPGSVTGAPSALAAIVPFPGARQLAQGNRGDRPALALIDPLAPNIVVLKARASPDPLPGVSVVPAATGAASAKPGDSPGPIELLGRLQAHGQTGALLDGVGAVVAKVRAGADVAFAPFDGQMVATLGQWYPSSTDPLLVVQSVARLFDVTIGTVVYRAVTVDAQAGTRSLAAMLAAGGAPRVIAARRVAGGGIAAGTRPIGLGAARLRRPALRHGALRGRAFRSRPVRRAGRVQCDAV